MRSHPAVAVTIVLSAALAGLIAMRVPVRWPVGSRRLARAAIGASALATLLAGVGAIAVFAVRDPGNRLVASLAGPPTSPRVEPGVAATVEAVPRPNILLISIDTLRPDHLRCYGYARETSPAIDSIAAQGALFLAALSPTSWTLPAHMTLLTALPPEGHGVVDGSARLGPKAVTLAEALRDAGYATAAFVSGPYLEAEYGFGQGFDWYDDHTEVAYAGKESHRTISSPGLVRLAGRWLDRWDDGGRTRPFFIFGSSGFRVGLRGDSASWG